MLGYFKYYNFFAESLQAALGRAGLSIPLGHLEVVLPIGISFYTFQSMSYVIDVYRREIKPTRNLVQFAVFVSFFPHLVAGPIMRPKTLLPQVASRRRFNLQQFYEGVYLIFWGLVEKVVVADNLAIVVNDLFGRWEALDGGLALLAVYAFAFQIYGDFSGYTDMARGVAKCLGFELPLNFNLPYFATSPRDFWNRWHISLSQWLRDYLYIPLGGSRGGSLLTYRNVMLTMILGGLWHGARWTFVCWGLYQGLLLVLHRLAAPWLERIQPADPIDRACWTGLRIIVTFHLVCLGWLIFRADSHGASRRHAGGDLRSGRRFRPRPIWFPSPSRSSRSCLYSSFSTPPTISTSSAVRPGMSVASSTRRAFTRSCLWASLGASSSSTFSSSVSVTIPPSLRFRKAVGRVPEYFQRTRRDDRSHLFVTPRFVRCGCEQPVDEVDHYEPIVVAVLLNVEEMALTSRGTEMARPATIKPTSTAYSTAVGPSSARQEISNSGNHRVHLQLLLNETQSPWTDPS